MHKQALYIKSIVIFFALLIIPGFAEEAAPTTPSPKLTAVGKLDADQLIADAEKALAYTVKSARGAGNELDKSNPDAKPFLESLKKIEIALAKSKKMLAANDEGFFTAINEANAGIAEMEVTWELAGSKNADVIAGAKKLGGAITALQENYNPLEQREAKGGDLTADEKTRFDKMKEQETELLKVIKDLYAKEKADPALEAGLKKIRTDAREIDKSPETVKAYADSVNLLSKLQGQIDGYGYFFTPAQSSEWSSVESYSTEFTSDYSYSDYSYDWSSTSIAVDVYDDDSVDISDAEVTSEDSYMEESSFEMTDAEETSVADEGDQLSEDDSDDMDSAQEQEDDQADEGDMDSGSDDSSDDGGE